MMENLHERTKSAKALHEVDPDLLTESPEVLPDTEVPHHQPDQSEEEVCTGISALGEDLETGLIAEEEIKVTQKTETAQEIC